MEGGLSAWVCHGHVGGCLHTHSHSHDCSWTNYSCIHCVAGVLQVDSPASEGISKEQEQVCMSGAHVSTVCMCRW